MRPRPRFRLSDAEKDALLLEQAEMIQRMATRIAELEAILGKPRKTSSNSHTPPSQDGPGRAKRPKRPARKRSSRPGSSRPLTEVPDKTERRMASACGHCGADVSAAIPVSRDQAFLLPPDAKEWLPADDVAHFVVEAVERTPLSANHASNHSI